MSVDPYMRPYVSRLTTPFTMIGMGVYKIRESRDTEYPQGGTVVANIGWVKTAINAVLSRDYGQSLWDQGSSV